eukprot:scaffold3697_cov55-Phaeocystis_antarctica.AAC.9
MESAALYQPEGTVISSPGLGLGLGLTSGASGFVGAVDELLLDQLEVCTAAAYALGGLDSADETGRALVRVRVRVRVRAGVRVGVRVGVVVRVGARVRVSSPGRRWPRPST